LEYSIFDITGRKILSYPTDRLSINECVEVDISGLKPGIYIIGARGDNNSYFSKLIVE
jgi:hypothetical protein